MNPREGYPGLQPSSLSVVKVRNFTPGEICSVGVFRVRNTPPPLPVKKGGRKAEPTDDGGALTVSGQPKGQPLCEHARAKCLGTGG